MIDPTLTYVGQSGDTKRYTLETPDGVKHPFVVTGAEAKVDGGDYLHGVRRNVDKLLLPWRKS